MIGSEAQSQLEPLMKPFSSKEFVMNIDKYSEDFTVNSKPTPVMSSNLDGLPYRECNN